MTKQTKRTRTRTRTSARMAAASKPVTQAEALATLSAALPLEENHSRKIKSIWGVAWLDELASILASCETYAPESNTKSFFFDDGSSLDVRDVKQHRGPARFTVNR